MLDLNGYSIDTYATLGSILDESGRIRMVCLITFASILSILSFSKQLLNKKGDDFMWPKCTQSIGLLAQALYAFTNSR